MGYRVFVELELKSWDGADDALDVALDVSAEQLKSVLVVSDDYQRIVERNVVGPCAGCNKPLYESDSRGIVDVGLADNKGLHTSCATRELLEGSDYTAEEIAELGL